MPREPIQEPQFLELRNLLGAEWGRCRESNPGYTIREAAKRAGVAHSTFNSWLLGHRRPSPKHLPGLITALFPLSSPNTDFDAFRDRLLEACKKTAQQAPTVLTDPGLHLQAQDRPFIAGVIVYPCFGANRQGTDQGFFGSVFEAFLNYAGLSVASDCLTLDSARTELCTKRSCDAVVAMLATPDRARYMRFFTTPITVPVNALMLSEHFSQLAPNLDAKLPTVLANSHLFRKAENLIAPIAVKEEVGDLYLKHILQYHDQKLVLYEAQDLANAISSHADERFPMLFADELMCAQVKLRLAQGNSTRYKAVRTQLVFGENTAAQVPRYQLGFAVDRRHTQWISYLDEAFPYFLRSNAEWLAHRYADLWRHLCNLVHGAFEASSMELPDTVAWQPLLGRFPSNLQGRRSRGTTSDIPACPGPRSWLWGQLPYMLPSDPWCIILLRAWEIIVSRGRNKSQAKEE